MTNKLFTTLLLTLFVAGTASGQRIVVDSASTSKYLITAKKKDLPPRQEEPTFSDRALSLGQGILNRLKARLNLEEAAESIMDKKEKILGNPEEKEKAGG